MKKINILSALMMTFTLSLAAQESLSVGEVLVPLGRQTMMEVQFQFNENHDYVSYQFTVNLPDGITFETKANGTIPIVLGNGQDADIYDLKLDPTTHNVTCYSNPSTRIGVNSGVLVYIPIKAYASLEIGKELSGTLTGVEFADISATAHAFDNVNFTIKVTDKIILDENNTWEPFATDDDCEIKVIRTLQAGAWSTICLPFGMDEDQLTSIFGDDVELAEYKKYTTQKEGTDVISITLNFDEVDLADGLEANTPYLIKTSKDISSFDITATLEPDDVKVGSTSKGFFYGTYKAGTIVPENSLFLSGNKFWYSTGKTQMKAFRGYFTLKDVLSSLQGASVKMFIDGEETGIEPLNAQPSTENTYDLSGRKVEKPQQRGVYIVNGKKMLKY